MLAGAEDNKVGYDRICEYSWTSERLFCKVCVIWLMSIVSGRQKSVCPLYGVLFSLFLGISSSGLQCVYHKGAGGDSLVL